LSTAVDKIDIKVINASFTQNQCLQYVTPPLRMLTWDTATARRRDATELNSDGMIKLGDVHYKTEPNLLIFRKEI